MNHRIKVTSIITVIAFGMFVAGCGESQAQKQAKERERQRIELEKQAARENQAAEKAVSDIEKKIGKKPQPLDLNLPDQKKTETPPVAPKS
jgi:hypothetical protein